MAAVSINWKPTDRQLRQFGWVCCVALPLLAWLFAGKPGWRDWQPFHTRLVGGLACAGAVLAVLGSLWPQILKPIFVGAMVVTFPIGLVISEVVLVLIYLIAFVPVALVFRLIGRDALERRLDRRASTYWQTKTQAPDKKSYLRQS